MRSFLIAALIAAPALAPAVAAAQPAPVADANTMAADDCSRAHKAGKTCVIKFETETLEGGVHGPDDLVVNVDQFFGHESLIKVRRDFIPEILRTAEDIE